MYMLAMYCCLESRRWNAEFFVLSMKYYIFEMPEDSERCAPQVIRRITLETKEEVQAFLNYISQQQKGR